MPLLVAVACNDAPRPGDAHQPGNQDASIEAGDPRHAAHVRACRETFDGGLLAPVGRDGGAVRDAGDAGTSPTPSFRNDLMPLFPTHCNFGGCHLGRETTGQMQLGDSCTYDLRLGTCTVDPSSLAPDVAATVHSNLLATSNAAPKLPRVTPGDVTRSFILMKLSGCQDAFPELTGCTYCGQFMPPGEPLRESDPALFELIARWIADGAKLD